MSFRDLADDALVQVCLQTDVFTLENLMTAFPHVREACGIFLEPKIEVHAIEQQSFFEQVPQFQAYLNSLAPGDWAGRAVGLTALSEKYDLAFAPSQLDDVLYQYYLGVAESLREAGHEDSLRPWAKIQGTVLPQNELAILEGFLYYQGKYYAMKDTQFIGPEELDQFLRYCLGLFIAPDSEYAAQVARNSEFMELEDNLLYLGTETWEQLLGPYENM